jgi:stage V sporulation protein S
MNRFFSKLDLRDIKIDPRTSRFLPDAEDEATEETDAGIVEATDAAAGAEPGINGAAQAVPGSAPDGYPARTPATPPAHERPRYVPSWAATPTDLPAPAPVPTAAPAPTPAPVQDEVLQHGVVTESVEVADDVALARSPEGQVEVLKVSARSRPSAVAGAIAGVVRESGRAEVQAIGAGATNQAVKAVAIARDYLRETGIEAICLPAFIDVTIENEDRTAIRLVVEPR